MSGMNLRDAAQQALDALRRIETLTSADWMLASKAVRDLSAALEDHECPNCASLEAQNAELDRRLAAMECKAPPCATQDCMPAQCERCIDPEVK